MVPTPSIVGVPAVPSIFVSELMPSHGSTPTSTSIGLVGAALAHSSSSTGSSSAASMAFGGPVAILGSNTSGSSISTTSIPALGYTSSGSSLLSMSASFAHASSSLSTASTSVHTLSLSGIHYATSTAEMEMFNQFGNDCEVPPLKHLFDTFLESAGFTSPKHPVFNPWKHRKMD
ncbi:hypothetical protein B0H10DRAFT_1963000 [Mycena sp. CBHHK59/15]|nr:hypothetical protein B0H10DRAFT_1963000 [Mycena sp. CBHHK59/15]